MLPHGGDSTDMTDTDTDTDTDIKLTVKDEISAIYLP